MMKGMGKASYIILALAGIIAVALIVIINPPPWLKLNKLSNLSPTPTASPSPKSDDSLVKTRVDSIWGEYLTDGNGRALYLWGGDTKSLQSSCYDICAINWPPYLVPAVPSVIPQDPKTASGELAKRINVIKRSDGTPQYAYGEKPLYYFKGDTEPGNVYGQNIDRHTLVLITK